MTKEMAERVADRSQCAVLHAVPVAATVQCVVLHEIAVAATVCLHSHLVSLSATCPLVARSAGSGGGGGGGISGSGPSLVW